jgi:hypothetical protein
MTVQRLAALVVTVLSMTACSSPAASIAPVVLFYGEATDPIGDTASFGDTRVALPADLVFAAAEVTDDAVRLAVRFAPGSLDPRSTGAMILLDTDLDAATGVPNFGVGAEYVVTLEATLLGGATLGRAVTDPGCEGSNPAIPCRFETVAHGLVGVGNDEMNTTIPRSAFGPLDGPLNFRVIAYAVLDDGHLTVTSDHMPNATDQFIAVR